MRFVQPDTTRLPLPGGEWVEVKNELPAIDEKRYRTAGFKRVRMENSGGGSVPNDVEMDWVALAFARVIAYVVGWNVKDAKGAPVPYSRDAVASLVTEDFDVLNAVVEAHVTAKEAEKKAQTSTPTGAPSSTVASS